MNKYEIYYLDSMLVPLNCSLDKDTLAFLQNTIKSNPNEEIIETNKNLGEVNNCYLIKKENDSYFVVSFSSHENNYNEMLKILNGNDGFFYSFLFDTHILTIKDSKYHTLYEGPISEVFNIDINPLKINKEDFTRYVYNVRKIGMDSFKSFTFRTSLIDNEDKWFSLENYFLDHNRAYGYILNIDKYFKEKEALVELSSKDNLTEIYNKNTIIDLAKIEIESSSKDCIILGILDIDFFKNINDTYGHLFGDMVLKAVASTLKNVIGGKGKVGRIGGDEFLFYFHNETDEEIDIKHMARKIRASLNSLSFAETKNFHITASFGMAAYPKNGKTYEELFQKADKALYRGKIKGRDCYIIYIDELHSMLNPNGEVKTEWLNNSKFQKLSNSTFISSCLDKLLNSKDLASTIEEVVRDITIYFRIDRVMISSKNLEILFYYSKYENDKLDHFYDILYDKNYISKFSSDNLFFINDINVLNINEENKYFSKYNIKSLVQVILYDNDEISGFMSFETKNDRRVWQNDELMYFNILGKIINGFFHKYLIEQRYQKLSYDDPLTKLKNFNKFKLEIENNNYLKMDYCLISFDVNRFRYINQKFGFNEGDKTLIAIGKVVKAHLANEELLCRTTDDKFLILLKFINNEELFIRFDEIRKAIENLAKNTPYYLSISSGAFVLNKKIDLITAIDNANISRKFAKQNNINTLVIYDEKISKSRFEENRIEDRMHQGIINHEFMVYLQPCFSIKNEKVSSYEALARWKIDDKIVPPSHFIPLFERNGFIIDLDFYIYEEVCRILRKWKREKRDIKRISVNVSRAHLKSDDFINKLNSLLESYGVEKKYFGLEVTESMFIDDDDAMTSFVKKLSESGYTIYMDDFGVAYSTLNLLGRIPVDVLKLDKSLVDNIFTDKKDSIIIKNIINMARELGMNVLSEGVESKEQLDKLSNLKCDYIQGYYYSKPITIEEIEEKYALKK